MSLKIGSLFCGGGVGESRLHELGCKTIIANEIREDRCNFFHRIHPGAETLCGSIVNSQIQMLGSLSFKICFWPPVDFTCTTGPSSIK